MDFRFQNTESGNLMQKRIVKIIVKMSGKFTSAAVELFHASKRQLYAESTKKYYFLFLFCFVFLFVFFLTNHDKEKKPNTVYDDTRRPRGSAFCKTGSYSDAIFFTKTRRILLTKQQPGNDWSMSYFCDLGRHVRCSEKLLTVDTFQDFQRIYSWCLEYTCTQ